jgi:hypothetical protein
LAVAFVQENDRIWGGGDTAVEAVGLSGFRKQEQRGAKQKGGERMPRRGLQGNLIS